MIRKKGLLIGLVSIFFIIVMIRITWLGFIKKDYYNQLLKEKTEIYISGSSAPRGRILDRKGRVIVDNIGVKTIVYHKLANVTTKEELKIAQMVASNLDLIQPVEDDILKEYYLAKYSQEAQKLITDQEYQMLKERKITLNDIKNYQFERIDQSILDSLDEEEKKISLVYHQMQNGYNYENKVLFTNISDKEYANILEDNIPGIFGEISWQRTYPYQMALKGIIGNVGKITKENKEYYLNKGYNITDLVGTSYLEAQYEDYLKGQNARYLVQADNSLKLVSEAQKGNDLVLNIDIDVQLKLEEILKEKILKAKGEKNTEYYKETYAIISDPNNGGIIAMAGKRYLGNDSWQDVTSNIINTSYTVGSVVKAASISVGYKNKIIDIGTKMKDSCIKLYLVPQKCSYKPLGIVDDVTALKESSNYYQFLIAIGLTNQKYYYNMKLNVTRNHFKIYRDTFEEFGLGRLSGIDLPNEQSGITGQAIADDLFLNLAIGQYDTYTPIQLSSYINAIANGGKVYAPSLMKEIKNDKEIILKNNYLIKNTINLEEKYMQRIRLGFNLVTTKGTGRGYFSADINSAGKTGTSETFYDSNSDGKMDVKTITTSFVGFFPYENPEYSIVLISPNISNYNGKDEYISRVNRYISKSITDFLFEK